MEKESFKKQMTIHLIAGSVGAIIVDTVSFPLDTIRTRLQVVTKNLKHDIPTKNLFSGFLPQILISAPAGGAYFFGYESTKKLVGLQIKKDNKTNQALFGGIGAECCGVLVRNPFEIIKQQMQVGNGTMSQVVSQLYNQNGFITFYRGFLSMLLREVPFSIIQMPIYETIKQNFLKDKDFMNTKESCIAALIAGGTAGIMTNPIDVVKTNIMTTQKQKKIQTFEFAKNLYKENGLSVFAKGLHVRAFYASFISVFFFLTYEKMREYLYHRLKKQFNQ